MQYLDSIYNFLILLVMATGLLGLILPIFPGLVVIWLGALGYGLYAGFQTTGWILFAIITIFMIVGSIIDNIVMGQQAHESGASWLSIVFALVFGILGNLIFPVIGGFIGALLALFVVEWIRRKNWHQAISATKGWAIGCGWAVMMRFLIGLIMIGLWLIWIQL